MASAVLQAHQDPAIHRPPLRGSPGKACGSQSSRSCVAGFCLLWHGGSLRAQHWGLGHAFPQSRCRRSWITTCVSKVMHDGSMAGMTCDKHETCA